MIRLASTSAQLLLLVAAVAALALLSGGIEPGRAQADPDYPRWGPASTAPAARMAANTAAVSTCPAAPAYSFTVADPTGDAFFGFGTGPVLHDITSVAVAGDPTTFCLTVSFAGPVEPGDANSAQSLYGYVEFDTDENFNTGFIPGNVDALCPDVAVIGVDMVLDMFTVVQGNALLYDPSNPGLYNLVPVTFAVNSFTAELPISALGGDTSFNAVMVLGTGPEPTDCAPNGGSTHSPDGSNVPAPTLPDGDGDGVPDLFDNCPDIANPDQLDSDFDFIGDVCDPTPTHDIAITRVRAEGAKLELDREEDDDDDDDTNGAGAGLPTAEIEIDVTMKNLLDQPENVFVAVGFTEGIPPGCQPVEYPFKEVPIRSGGKKHVELVFLITCDPTVATPGKYTLNIEVLAFPTGGGDLDDSNNIVQTTARLRLRD